MARPSLSRPGWVQRMPACWSVVYHLDGRAIPGENPGFGPVPPGVGRGSLSKVRQADDSRPLGHLEAGTGSSARPKWICNPEVIWKFLGSLHKKVVAFPLNNCVVKNPLGIASQITDRNDGSISSF